MAKEKSPKENALDCIGDDLMEAIMNESIPIQKVREFVEAELKGYERQARNMLKGSKGKR